MERCVPSCLCSALGRTKGLGHAKHMLQLPHVYGQDTESIELYLNGFLNVLYAQWNNFSHKKLLCHLWQSWMEIIMLSKTSQT